MATDLPAGSWSAALFKAQTTEEAVISRCVELARSGIRREFPCQLPLMLTAAVNFHRPRDVTPVFYGCYDWHSAVHSHWLLVRAVRCFPGAVWSRDILELLEAQFDPQSLAQEAEFLSAPERTGFERPYGLAWLLQLVAELREWNDPLAQTWCSRFAPLEVIARERMQAWLERLLRPIRTGEHSQSAFAMGLMADYARITGNSPLRSVVQLAAIRCHHEDRSVPMHLEPSAYDFLSPSLASADLMRRVLSRDEFSSWLDRAWSGKSFRTSMIPVQVSDPRDGKLAHFAGLNFSRTWMAAGIAQGLPADHRARPILEQIAAEHLTAGLPILWSDEYAITHWVGSFAMYAVTHRGLECTTADE